MQPASLVFLAAILLLCAACGDSGEPTSRSRPAADAAAAPGANESPRTAVELTDATLAAWERGMRREIEEVRAAQKRASDATTPQARGEAIQSSFEHVTIPFGAEAAGLPVEQYRVIREAVDDTFRTLDFQGKIDGPLSIDLSRADDVTKERLALDPFADLSSASATALRAQMDRLVPIWIEYVNLTAVAG